MKNASELTKEWMKEYALGVMKSIGSGATYRTRDLQCWNMYHSKLNTDNYNYLVKFGDFDLPVQIRFTSIVRPNVDYLVSKYLSNPFNFSTFSVDKKSLEQKYRQKIDKYIDSIETRIRARYDAMSMQIDQINSKMQEMQMMLQQEPQNEEHMKQMQQLQQAMPMIQLKMKQMTDAMQKEMARDAKRIDKMQILGKFTAEDIREDFAYKRMRAMYEEEGIQEEHRRSFLEKCVTGRPYIYVDIVDGKIVYENKPSITVYHPKTMSQRFIEDGDWVAVDEYWSRDNVLNQYGESMTEDERRRIKRNNNTIPEVYTNTAEGTSYTESEGVGITTSYNDVRTTKIYFSVTAKNRYKVSPSKGDIPHVNRYDGGSIRPEDKIENRYMKYNFEATVIDSNIIVDVKERSQDSYLYVDHPSKKQLPIIGDNYDDVTRVPYSLIWATRNLQSMHTIIEYHKEMLLVIAGVKGFIMDQSQLPEGMGKHEWMYYRKLGVLWIETYKKDRRQQPNFNQFQQFDDTISSGIQYLSMLQQQIQAQVDQITGVTRQARGDIQNRDLVGASELAIQATSIIADVLFWEHDQVIRRALTRALNLYCKHIGVNGDIFSLIDKYVGSNTSEPVHIPPGLLDGVTFDIIVMNNNKNFRDMETIRQAVMGEYGRGKIDLLGMAELNEAQSYPELKRVAQSLVERANEIASQQGQAELDREKELLKFENELKAPVEQMNSQLKEYELQLKKLDLDLKEKQIIFENEIKGREMESKVALGVLDILTEREIELKYLDEQKAARQVDDILEQARIITDAMIGKQTNDVKERVSMRPKERIKD